MTRNLCIVLGDQLSQNITSLKNLRKEDDKILMMEVVNEATYVNHHKKKLILILSAMRHFAEDLKKQGYTVIYSKINNSSNTFTEELVKQCKNTKPKKIVITHPGEYRVIQEIKKWKKIVKIPVSIVEDERFFCNINEFEKWAASKKELKMETFYKMMRKKYNILIDENGKDHAIFSGDTLFIGDVGRPDLAVKSDLSQDDLAGLLYDSLRNKII